jgi:alcohol dehydrogenase YqhD (iron-dependent ADH family)
LGLKTRLNQLGIDDKDFEAMAKRATAGGNVGHYVPLDAQKITDILKLAL